MSSITTSALSFRDTVTLSFFADVVERVRALLSDMAQGQDAAVHYRQLTARGVTPGQAAAKVFALYYAGR